MSDAAVEEPKDDATPSDVEMRRIAEKRAHTRITLLIPVFIAGLLFVGVSLVVWFHHRATGHESPDLSFSVDSVVGAFHSRSTADSDAGQHAAMDQIHSDMRQVGALMQIVNVRRAGEAHDTAVDDWKQRLHMIAESDVGQRIASDEPSWQRLVALVDLADTVTSLEWRAELQQMHDRANDSSLSGVGVSESISALRDRIDKATADLMAYDTALDRLVQVAESRQRPSTSVGNIFDFQRRQREADLDAARNEAKKSEDESFEKVLSSLRTQSAELLAESKKLEQQLNEIESGVRAPSSSLAKVAAQGSPVEFRARLPEIRQLLKPFISPGYAQPAGRDQFQFEQVKRPMSYAALVNCGALDDSQSGLETLFRIGGWKSQNQQNDRPLGTFPRMNSDGELAKSEIRDRVYRAQQLLREFGANLIADGMLVE